MLVEEQYLLTQHFCDSSPQGGEDDSAYQCKVTVYKNLDSNRYPEDYPAEETLERPSVNR